MSSTPTQVFSSLDETKRFLNIPLSNTDSDSKIDVGVEIHSGRNRIIRRMFAHLGYDVEKLDRVYFAGLTKKDTHIVLQLWNNLYESIRGESQDMLIQIAQKIELPGAAQHMLGQRKLGPRFQAILLLGNTKNHDAWDELAKLTGDKSQFLSLRATEALVRIDAGRAIIFLNRNLNTSSRTWRIIVRWEDEVR